MKRLVLSTFALAACGGTSNAFIGDWSVTSSTTVDAACGDSAGGTSAALAGSFSVDIVAQNDTSLSVVIGGIVGRVLGNGSNLDMDCTLTATSEGVMPSTATTCVGSPVTEVGPDAMMSVSDSTLSLDFSLTYTAEDANGNTIPCPATFSGELIK